MKTIKLSCNIAVPHGSTLLLKENKKKINTPLPRLEPQWEGDISRIIRFVIKPIHSRTKTIDRQQIIFTSGKSRRYHMSSKWRNVSNFLLREKIFKENKNQEWCRLSLGNYFDWILWRVTLAPLIKNRWTLIIKHALKKCLGNKGWQIR